jgi:magnesium chelatase subunit I
MPAAPAWPAPVSLPKTLAELRASGWKSRTVKEEVWENFLRMLATGDELFPGIVGSDAP